MDHRCSDLRVLHVVASTDRRGAEIAAVQLCEQLKVHRIHGSAVALAPGTHGGLDVPLLGRARYGAPTLRRLRDQARVASVVVAHGSSTLPAVTVAMAGTGKPFVYRSIGDPQAWVTTPARRLRVGIAARRAARIVALWRGSAVAWHRDLGIRSERIVVIPNGVNARKFAPVTSAARREVRAAMGLPPDGPIVMCLGALSPEKRLDLAIRAVALLEDATLAVVGDGIERRALVDLAATVGPGRVIFLGSTDHPEYALAAADILMLPSDTEGLPAVAIEAGLSGLPVVATRVGGVADIVLDGRTGVLVDRGNVSRLADATRVCLARREEFGAAGRARCTDKFNIEDIAQKWCCLLQSVIKTGSIRHQSSQFLPKLYTSGPE